MDVVARIVAWLNRPANALGRSLLAPIGVLPGWLSATIVSVVTGWLLLLVFKYTSNQRAIRRVRDDISAHLLALKLFKDSTSVILRRRGGSSGSVSPGAVFRRADAGDGGARVAALEPIGTLVSVPATAKR